MGYKTFVKVTLLSHNHIKRLRCIWKIQALPSFTFLCTVSRTLKKWQDAVLKKMNGTENPSGPMCEDAE